MYIIKKQLKKFNGPKGSTFTCRKAHTWSLSTLSRFALDEDRSSPMLATLGLELRNVLDDSSGARRFVFLMTGPDVFRSEDLRRLWE